MKLIAMIAVGIVCGCTAFAVLDAAERSMGPEPVRPPKGMLSCDGGEYLCTLHIEPVGHVDYSWTCNLNTGMCWDDPPKPEGR